MTPERRIRRAPFDQAPSYIGVERRKRHWAAAQILRQVKRAARDHYAWPGGYELFAICDDGGTLCFKCCRSEFRQIAKSTIGGYRDGWKCAAVDNASNCEETLTCDHCCRIIFEDTEAAPGGAS